MHRRSILQALLISPLALLIPKEARGEGRKEAFDAHIALRREAYPSDFLGTSRLTLDLTQSDFESPTSLTDRVRHFVQTGVAQAEKLGWKPCLDQDMSLRLYTSGFTPWGAYPGMGTSVISINPRELFVRNRWDLVRKGIALRLAQANAHGAQLDYSTTGLKGLRTLRLEYFYA